MRRLIWIAIITVLGTAPVSAEPSPTARLGQHERSVVGTLTRGEELRYLLHLPEGYGEVERSWPLILFLHGEAGRGRNIERVRLYRLPRLVDMDPSIPFIVVSPQCPEAETWTDTEVLIALIDEVCATYAVDEDRIYLAGYDMGATGAWYLAYRHPERFAAIAPMAGPASPGWSSRLGDLPIWVFHGARDNTIPLAEIQTMLEALSGEGAEVRISVDPARDHSPPSVAEHRLLLDWFLEHRRHDGSRAAQPKPGG